MSQNSNNGLNRTLGLFPTTNIVIANMIGAGIFTTSGLLMGNLHDPVLLILLWIVGGIIALCGAFSYGELGAAIPYAGGEYIFLSKLFHPLFGFLSGWVSFFAGFSAPIAASAIGFSEYFTRAFPQFLQIGILTAPVLKKGYALIILLVFTFIHLRGIKFGAKVQNYLTLLKVGLIVVLIVLGFSSGDGNIQHFSQGSSLSFNLSGWQSIGLSLMWIMFAYSGWNAATYIGSEIKNPSRNLPRSLLIGTGIVILLYVCLNLLFVYSVPPGDMEGVISIGGLAVDRLFGRSMEQLFSLMIAAALFSSLSAFIILGPRVYYSMAKDGYFFKFVMKIHPKFQVPTKSILLQGVIAAIMVLTGTFDQILTYMGFALGIFPILAVFAVFKLRRSAEHLIKLPGFPFVQIIYITAGLLILFLAFIKRPAESSIALFMALTGIPAYFVFKTRHKKQEG